MKLSRIECDSAFDTSSDRRLHRLSVAIAPDDAPEDHQAEILCMTFGQGMPMKQFAAWLRRFADDIERDYA